MALHLNKYNSLEGFLGAKDSIVAPHISLIEGTGVAYKRTSEDDFTAHNGTSEQVSLSLLPQQPIDLGLPSGLKWASCNVGAEKPEDYGLYFAWGEINGYGSDVSDARSFDWASYQLCGGSNTTLTKYNNNSSYGTVDNKTTLEAADDAASQNLSLQWRMPTQAEFQELLDNTTATWTTQNGVNGGLFTATNGKSIFLPAAGYRGSSSLYNVGSLGYYWSSSLSEGYAQRAWYLGFRSSVQTLRYGDRSSGYSVRPVLEIS